MTSPHRGMVYKMFGFSTGFCLGQPQSTKNKHATSARGLMYELIGPGMLPSCACGSMTLVGATWWLLSWSSCLRPLPHGYGFWRGVASNSGTSGSSSLTPTTRAAPPDGAPALGVHRTHVCYGATLAWWWLPPPCDGDGRLRRNRVELSTKSLGFQGVFV